VYNVSQTWSNRMVRQREGWNGESGDKFHAMDGARYVKFPEPRQATNAII